MMGFEHNRGQVPIEEPHSVQSTDVRCARGRHKAAGQRPVFGWVRFTKIRPGPRRSA